jgi:hypothetical protein
MSWLTGLGRPNEERTVPSPRGPDRWCSAPSRANPDGGFMTAFRAGGSRRCAWRRGIQLKRTVPRSATRVFNGSQSQTTELED